MNCDDKWLYILVWNVIVLVGTAYIVFWKKHSGWWFLLAVILLMIPRCASKCI